MTLGRDVLIFSSPGSGTPPRHPPPSGKKKWDRSKGQKEQDRWQWHLFSTRAVGAFGRVAGMRETRKARCGERPPTPVVPLPLWWSLRRRVLPTPTGVAFVQRGEQAASPLSYRNGEVHSVEWLCLVHGEEVHEKVQRYFRHLLRNRAQDVRREEMEEHFNTERPSERGD